MSDETEQNNQIALFMEISGESTKRLTPSSVAGKVHKMIAFVFSIAKGADFDTAKHALTANNFNLEQAINYHLERSNSVGAPEDDVAGKRDSHFLVSRKGFIIWSALVIDYFDAFAINRKSICRLHFLAASTSTDANLPNLPIDDEDEVRPPILPKREQLILPNEDNFRYRKRRTATARTVCPLRNFELEGRMQEERLKAAVLSDYISLDASADIDPASFAAPDSLKPKPNVLGFANSTREFLQGKVVASAQPATKSTAPSRLSELFRPPVDITFCGSFQAARDYAKEQNKWLIVNVQDMSNFNCQVLNRDIWSSEKLRGVIKKYFIFWQVAIDNTDGHRFQVFYGIQVFPYVGIIDPRTGEEKLSYKTGFQLTLNEFMTTLKDYLLENTPHPNAVSVNVTVAVFFIYVGHLVDYIF